MTPYLRLATIEDCAAIEHLIGESARGLGREYYTEAEIEAALHGPWGLDTQLIEDGTYFVASIDRTFAECGGWSFRKTLFGSDAEISRDSSRLDPETDAARIRAFFVHPRFARCGLGSLILNRCEREASSAGFSRATLGATLLGRRFYAARGYVSGSPSDYDLGAGMAIEIFPMTKRLAPGSA